MKTTMQHHLSKRDLTNLLSLSHHSLVCRNHDELKKLVLDLQNIFEFDNTLYGRINLPELFSDEITPRSVELYNINYPADFVTHYFARRHYLNDSSVQVLLNKLRPVNCYTPIDSYSTARRCTKAYLDSIKKKNITSANTWMHGTLDSSAFKYIGFVFLGQQTKHRERVLDILDYIIPFYSEAFNRISKSGKNKKNEKKVPFNLTPKEIEILQWIKEGKSSWDISVMLECSKRTVDFHVENAKTKLNTVSRAQAIAVALHYGAITF